MANLQEKRKTFQTDLEASSKARDNMVAQLNGLNQRIEQLRGAIFALDELAKEETEEAKNAEKPALSIAPAE